MKKPNWLEKLENRWQVNTIRAILILVVFACTGFTVFFLKEPILSSIAPADERTWVFSLVYYILIFPIYNVILLFYGFIFGQFNFFWAFEKRMFRRMAGKKGQ
ncbi:prolipoprotein diacylglyceryl transferase [Fulvivirga maritima]|uniref:DUF6787 family protein n=1 Tax=Fulvivirga maritima TaxID=2904247 RepID=UPI001F440581|nr:DUF6787 family protein [Fulvivirga maritima]UII28687.1 prolipoprotein diacylglyceryl transferase [Fulvivirga maritima]